MHVYYNTIKVAKLLMLSAGSESRIVAIRETECYFLQIVPMILKLPINLNQKFMTHGCLSMQSIHENIKKRYPLKHQQSNNYQRYR